MQVSAVESDRRVWRWHSVRCWLTGVALAAGLVLAGCEDAATAAADSSAETIAGDALTDGAGTDVSLGDGGSDLDCLGCGDLGWLDLDTESPDLPPLDCPGGAYCACDNADDCNSGLCIDTPEGKQCAASCSANCTSGWTCANVNAGAEFVQICVPKWGFLCEPCQSSAQCQSALGLVGASCVVYGTAGAYCGASCNSTADCPQGYSCAASTTTESTSSKQCVKDVAAGSDPCSCDARAATLKLGTLCFAVSGEAQCPGSRQCLGDGSLTPCNAPPAAQEVCDGLDNDCNGKTDDGLCDDNKPCTDDLCDGAGKLCTYKNRSGACDDGTACTQNDTCAQGECLGGQVQCDDKNPCTTEYCDAKKGCVYTPASGECQDGDPCTVGDSCKDGACAAGNPKECTDGNACTSDSCLSASGGCDFKVLNGTPCSDGNACTGPDSCAGDTCKGLAANCNDGNPCTDDSCSPATGCTNLPTTLGCNDGNACTTTDTCDGKGGCVGLALDPTVSCNDNNPCTADSCDQTSGCANQAQAGTCDDNNPCTNGDLCQAGACNSGSNVCACQQDTDCAGQEDGNACNGTLYCNKAMAPFVCEIKPGSAVTCDTSTDTICKKTSCQTETGQCLAVSASNGLSCDADGSICTENDACVGGSCKAGQALDCNDGQLCTTDSCDNANGCKNTYNALACSDNNPCTVDDVCNDGGCKSGSIKICDDNSTCTTDSCNLTSGECQFIAITGDCDADGSVCTENDACDGGVCKAGPKQSCDDSKVCTTDSCSPLTGCSNSANTLPCDADGNACTENDFCQDGGCKTGTLKTCNDNSVCTTDSCNTSNGECQFIAITGDCDADGSVCTENDACDGGLCKAGPKQTCDDGKVCTTDNCSPLTGCSNAANTLPCDFDGNACTENDFCQDGGCYKGPAKDCNDGSPCTIDSCEGGSGDCQYVPNEGVINCTDGNACTVLDSCDKGVCKSGPQANCEDGQACTTDGCDAGTGCTNVPADAGSSCDDGNLCTKFDTCAGTTCKGLALNCDDNNPCTTDSCTGSGCSNVALNDAAEPAGCAAGSGSHCVSGQCRVKGCGDGWLDGTTGEQCDDNNTTACDGCELCRVKTALKLATAGDCVRVPVTESSTSNAPGELSPTGDFTVELWLKADKLTDEQVVVSKGQGATSWTLSLTGGATPGLLKWYQTGAFVTETLSTTAVTAGAWHHVAVVTRGEALQFFVNGQPAGTAAYTLLRKPAPGPLALGCVEASGQPATAFAGLIDEVHIAAAPLYTAAFVPARRTQVVPQTAGLWRFDETGTTPTTVLDASGYGRSGTLGTATLAVDGCHGADPASAVCGDGVVDPKVETCDESASGSAASNACDGCNACKKEGAFLGVDALGAATGALIQTKPLSQWLATAINTHQELTFEAWVRTPDKATTGIYQIFGTSCGLLEVVLTSGRFGVFRSGFVTPPHTGATTVTSNTWYHLAVVIPLHITASMRIYVNGKLDNNPATTFPAANTAAMLTDIGLVGAGAPAGACINNAEPLSLTRQWTGQLDDVRISNGNRYGAATQFVPPRRLYADAQTVALWRFDRAFGNTPYADDSGNTAVVDKAVAGLVTADSCFGEPTNTRICGDGSAAKYEFCDAGTANGVPPASCTACSFAQTPDTTSISWTAGQIPLLGASATSTVYKTGSPYVSWTLEGWIRVPSLPASGSIGVLFAQATNTTGCSLMNDNQGWRIAMDSAGNDASYLRSDNTASATKAVWKAGVWQHFALSFVINPANSTLSRGTLFVDGIAARSYSGINPGWNGNCPVTIGGEKLAGTTAQKTLAGQLAGLRWTKYTRYSQNFQPSWTLPTDMTAQDDGWSFAFDTFENSDANATTMVGNQKYSMTMSGASKVTTAGPGTP